MIAGLSRGCEVDGFIFWSRRPILPKNLKIYCNSLTEWAAEIMKEIVFFIYSRRWLFYFLLCYTVLTRANQLETAVHGCRILLILGLVSIMSLSC